MWRLILASVDGKVCCEATLLCAYQDRDKVGLIQKRLDPKAKIGKNVSIGLEHCSPDVEIGDNCDIASHVIRPSIIKSNKIYQFSTIGDDTPDLKYKGEPTKLIVGDNVIHEASLFIAVPLRIRVKQLSATTIY